MNVSPRVPYPLAAVAFVVFAVVTLSCRREDIGREHSGAAAPVDSATAVHLAIDAINLGKPRRDQFPLQVHQFSRDSAGFHIVLVPRALIQGGGGEVWLTTRGEVRRLVRGQ